MSYNVFFYRNWKYSSSDQLIIIRSDFEWLSTAE